MAKTELSKTYNAQSVEDKIYQQWEESGFFNPDNLPGKRGDVFSVAMPPPNVTGILHLGHAFENALMDIEVRFQRMIGKKALLVPGTDHAAVATQARVEDDLKKQGIKNPRLDLGRDELLSKIRSYAESSKKTILSQIRKMGTSCDWSRLSYTFDEPRSRAVNALFKMMHEDGLIYRGYRVVNWSVKGQSTCSDDELVYRDEKTRIYTFKYASDFPIPIATTRPETKLGDTAVAVHPDDKRYLKYIGRKFTVDIGALKPLVITVISDSGVDPDYGTGAVGVTPAHSPVDYEMYVKNKEIGLIPVIGQDGKMTESAGSDYAGLSVLKAREKFVSWLKKNDLLIKSEDSVHSVGTSDRFGDVVEALPMEQWFVDVNKKIKHGKTLKELLKDAVTVGHGGDSSKIINIKPDRFVDIYLHWIDNLRDWCISRQIWWGHRIPVWYRNEDMKVSEVSPGSGWVQDEDTLDTWFSSGAWTFSTLGWPGKTSDLKKFHPTSWMQMGYEILFFWMARMILMSAYALDDIPFKDVYIHGMLRDKNGRKFSKSLGTGLDPLEIISQYGADALRLSLVKGIAPGNDARFYPEKVEGARNFVNKLWNISRYILSSVDEVKLVSKKPSASSVWDEYILSKLDLVAASVTSDLSEFEFSRASETLHDFTWGDFADWYLEVSKIEKGKDDILLFLLQNILKLWHPFCPFVTEEIWRRFDTGSLLMVESWPEGGSVKNDFSEVDMVKDVIAAIRNLRSENGVKPAKLVKVVVSGKNYGLVGSNSLVIKKLSRLGELIVDDGQKPENSVSAVLPGLEIYLSLSGIIDVKEEKKKLKKEIKSVEDYLLGLEKKLGDSEFVKNAPKAVVDGEKKKSVLSKEKVSKLKKQLKGLE